MPSTATKPRPTPKVPKAPRTRVGDKVGLAWAGKLLLALVIEDRGNLGAHGERIVRIDIPDGAVEDERMQLEVPADWLVAAPTSRRRLLGRRAPGRTHGRNTAP